MSQYGPDYMVYAWQTLRGDRAKLEQSIHTNRQRDVESLLPPGPWQVLDIGNGRLRPQYTLLKATGHKVVGIDIVNRSQRSWKDVAYVAARSLFHLHTTTGRETRQEQTIVCGDVGYLPFPDASFDLLTSNAAFEHFLDVPRVVDEVARVLRPGGVAWVNIHLFTALSGGHNLHFGRTGTDSLPSNVEAWDHLRRRRLPFHVPLNQWRRDQYLETFARHLTLKHHYCVRHEGEELLTPQIEAELSTYTRDELTCVAYTIVAQKAYTE